MENNWLGSSSYFPQSETRHREIDPGAFAAFVPGEQPISPAVLAWYALWLRLQLLRGFDQFPED